jgi:hypothetical protein
MRSRLPAALITCGMTALALPGASLAAETIGGQVTTGGSTTTCQAGTTCTFAQTQPSTAGPVQQVASPIDGVITRWRAVGSGNVALQVLNNDGGTTASATSTSSPATHLDGQPNPVRIPIAAGQRIGVALPVPPGGSIGFIDITNGGTYFFWQPALDGNDASAVSGVSPSSLKVNADVEPDADADQFGDETQDGCATNPFTQGACNDHISGAQTLTGSSASVAGTTLRATRQFNEPDHCVTATGPAQDCGTWTGLHSVWYRWTAPRSGQAVIDTCEASIDSILAVYTGGGSFSSLTRVVDDNNACLPGSFGSRVSFEAVQGTTYRIAVGDAGGAQESDFTLKLAGPAPPPPPPDTTPPETTITVGPKDVTKDKAAAFGFGSGEAESRFECRLDAGAFEACTSIKTYTVKKGNHDFEVRAIDPAGNVDPTPAANSWKLKKKKKRKRK